MLWDCSSISKFQLLAAAAPSRGPASLGTNGCGKDRLILIAPRLPQISCFTLSLNCFSSDSDSCPHEGIEPLLQFPHLLRAGPALLTLLFPPLVPSSYRVLRGSIYSFPLVRHSHPLSAGVPHVLLCLKVYPDESMERDVLRVHLLLRHHVLSLSLFMYLEIFISLGTFCFVFIVDNIYIYIYIYKCITHECPA